MQTKNITEQKGAVAMSGNKGGRNKKIIKEKTGYIMIAPFIIIFLVFGLYPIINTIAVSFTDRTLMKQSAEFVGLKNFRTLFKDKFFWASIGNTWKIWAMNFIPQIGIAMLIAVWLTDTRLKIKAVGFWRAIFYLPNLLMPITVAGLYRSIFTFYGPANQMLVRAGLVKEALDFFLSANFAQGLVAFIQWWMWFGNTLIILVAGMTSISVSLYESAMVDGANEWEMFWRITLPALRPVLVYNLVTSLVGGMQMFDIPFMLTNGKGSPNGSIMTMNVFMNARFQRGSLGDSAAVGLCILFITTVCSLLIFYVLRDKDAILERKLKKAQEKAHKEKHLNVTGGN